MLPITLLITLSVVCQAQPLTAIITMPGSGNDQPQHPPSASSGQQAQETTIGPTGSFNNFLNSDSASAGGNGGSQQHLHTLGLDCFVSPCHGVCQFRPSSDSSRPAVPMDSDIPLESDPCPICLVHFHGRDEALVVVKSQCCGKHFDLDCISKCFVDQPIGSRRCTMCRQDPMPMLNENTGESHPDTFFPDEAFYRACLEGDLSQVENSLADGVNVNAFIVIMDDDSNALMLAACMGHTDIAVRLINAGANINARSESGATALFIAAQENKIDCLKLLIETKADINARTEDGSTALCIAALKNSTDCVKLLINVGADLNVQMRGGATPLFIAARKNNTDCVKILIEAKADLNTVLPNGATPLHVAAENGSTDCVKVLIKAGADLNAALTDGTTPLSIATRMGNTNCVKALTKAGARQGASAIPPGL
ncbi:ankyrin repeat domain-containing protein [Endozoicomonas sp. SESOKO3]|uniref:ankyrin repeat domain-containing protein n=1 Tax=Endozoicomonas sp. SESOKO3 TaxID=2828744 RepID=UPI002147A2DE|nr:ankyrin repeat domain-containing protein [Endozoicomonas sp. SESOKO3]